MARSHTATLSSYHSLSSLSLSVRIPLPRTDSRQSSFARSDPSQLLPIIWVLGFTPTGSTTCPTGAGYTTRARWKIHYLLEYRFFRDRRLASPV